MNCISEPLEVPDTYEQHSQFTMWYILRQPHCKLTMLNVLQYPPPPHTIHPPHLIATILEESVFGTIMQKSSGAFTLKSQIL